jgi:hypothetical protein
MAASHDDTKGEARRTPALHQPGYLMPVEAVSVDLGQRTRDAYPL